MSIAEVIEGDGERDPLPIRVRRASLRDYEEMCSLFTELDELHRQARPEMFQPFPPPARTREQVAGWLAQPDSTVLVAQSDGGVVGLAVLLTRQPSSFAGAVPRKVVEVDNLVVHADQRGRRVGRRLLAAAVEWSRQRRGAPRRGGGVAVNPRAQGLFRRFGLRPPIDPPALGGSGAFC